jgi:hypothetical protein
LSQFNGIEPVSISTLVKSNANSQALSRVADWREQNQLLTLTAPDDTGVQQSKKELEDRNHASIQHQSTFSRSRADQPEVLQNLTGSSEREHQTRINRRGLPMIIVPMLISYSVKQNLKAKT